MTTSLPRTCITIRNLSALIAGIPSLIGFPPKDSLVLFTFNRRPTLMLGTTLRYDLPAPEHVEGAAEHLVAVARQNRAVAAIAIVVGGGTPDEHRPLVDALRQGFTDNDILLVHANWVHEIRFGERWQCYLDPQCTDEVPDPQTTALAVAAAIAGDPTYRDREEMAAQLAPDPAESLARREELLDAHLRTPQPQYTEDDLTADLALITQLQTETEASPNLPVLTDRQLVRAARAVSRPEVRDECLGAALAGTPRAGERLWTVLTRALPAPERAEPAVLLAMSAYLRGAGTLAGLAIKTALAANPAHSLANTLDAALTHAVPPSDLRDMLLRSVLKNEGIPEGVLPPACPATDVAGPAVPVTVRPAPPPRGSTKPAVTPPEEPPPPTLNTRTAATLGLLTAAPPATFDPLTAFLPPRQVAVEPNGAR